MDFLKCWVAGLYHKVTFCYQVDWCSRSALEPKTAYGLHHRSVSMLIFKKVETLVMYDKELNISLITVLN